MTVSAAPRTRAPDRKFVTALGRLEGDAIHVYTELSGETVLSVRAGETIKAREVPQRDGIVGQRRTRGIAVPLDAGEDVEEALSDLVAGHVVSSLPVVR